VHAPQALEKAGKSNVPAVAFMCDIDRFKAINGEFGHDFGDRVLIEIAEAMRSFGEANGMVVARHGGEEFAAFMIDVTIEQAVQHANALRRIFAAKKISISGDAFASVTLSIGLATSNDPTTLLDIMRTADQAFIWPNVAAAIALSRPTWMRILSRPSASLPAFPTASKPVSMMVSAATGLDKFSR
jgi:diguanylate cyclase (GGDEF)-like protein